MSDDTKTPEDITSEAANLLSAATMKASHAFAHVQDQNPEGFAESRAEAIKDAKKAIALLEQI